MFRAPIYKRIPKSELHYKVGGFLAILFTSGMTFTFVIPGLKGFDSIFLAGAIFIYYVIANIFEKVFIDQRFLMFLLTCLSSSLGMVGRILLEWGEYSLIEHMNIFVIIGYPITVALLLLLMTFGLTKL